MKNRMAFPLLLMIFAFTGANHTFAFANALKPSVSANAMVQLLSKGEPGCVDIVSTKALTGKAAKKISKKCQFYRNAYLKSLEYFSKRPDEFKKLLTQVLQQSVKKKTKTSPYHAILFTAFVRDSGLSADLKKALKARADMERNLKMPDQYGAAMEERLENDLCLNYPKLAYHEVCESNDVSFEQMAQARP